MELETKRKELEQSDKAVKDELVREVKKLKRKVNMWEEEEVERLTRAKAAKERRDRRERTEAEIRRRFQIEEYERERLRDEIQQRCLYKRKQRRK